MKAYKPYWLTRIYGHDFRTVAEGCEYAAERLGRIYRVVLDDYQKEEIACKFADRWSNNPRQTKLALEWISRFTREALSSDVLGSVFPFDDEDLFETDPIQSRCAYCKECADTETVYVWAASATGERYEGVALTLKNCCKSCKAKFRRLERKLIELADIGRTCRRMLKQLKKENQDEAIRNCPPQNVGRPSQVPVKHRLGCGPG